MQCKKKKRNFLAPQRLHVFQRKDADIKHCIFFEDIVHSSFLCPQGKRKEEKESCLRLIASFSKTELYAGNSSYSFLVLVKHSNSHLSFELSFFVAMLQAHKKVSFGSHNREDKGTISREDLNFCSRTLRDYTFGNLMKIKRKYSKQNSYDNTTSCTMDCWFC